MTHRHIALKSPLSILTAAALSLVLPACTHAPESVGSRPAPTLATATPASAAEMPATPPAPATDARAAVERALPFLARDGDWWMTGGKDVPGGGGCVSCHHVAFGLWSNREAQRAGLPRPQKQLDDLETRAHRFFTEKISKAEPVPLTELLLARKPTDRADGAAWPAFLKKLASDQNGDGSWTAGGQFPTQRRPVPESDAVATAWALIALDSVPGLDPSLVAARTRAWAWASRQSPGASNESLLTRLLIERRLGKPTSAQTQLAQLLARQRPDGGWAWLADGTTSDALTTGEVLYALRLAGLPPDHPALRRATDHLLRTQAADGTWPVRSELISKKGEHGNIDYIYRYWGTAWATIGLSRTLTPPATTAHR